jgi:1-acyl-sn-glycerol-3-phosphate acyltransferase
MINIQNIKGRLWALWGLLTFAATFIVIFIPSLFTYLLPDPMGSKVFIFLARIWMNVWLPLAGCPVTVKGKKHFRKNQVYIVTCNHNSLMDVPLSSPFIPGANKTIAKKSFARIPLFGLYYRKGSVLVDRKDENSRKASYYKMKEVLAKGIHMCIYPEGTRNVSDAPLAAFQSGAFRLSAETKTPIIPAVILHTRKVFPAGKGFFFAPHPLEIHFLPPIPVLPDDTSESLKVKTHRAMLEHLLSNTN